MAKTTANLINFNPDPTDLPGYPTYADVHAAMSRDGDKADHTAWALTRAAWDAVAQELGYSVHPQSRRQQAYEAAARVLAAYRAGKAVATVRPAPAKPAAAPTKGARVLFDATRPIRSHGFWSGDSAEMTDEQWDQLADQSAFLDRYVKGCI